MINTLQTGAANLTLADMNEEAANLLALQTRQSLSQSSLSLASQADQSVLQLIRYGRLGASRRRHDTAAFLRSLTRVRASAVVRRDRRDGHRTWP